MMSNETIIQPQSIIKLINLGDNKNIDKIFEKLKRNINCTYLTYMIEDDKQKIHFSSNSEWQKKLISEGLINICPIYKYAFNALKNNKSNIFTIWDYVFHKKGEELDLLDYRSSFDIAHGMGIAIQQGNRRESIVFASSRDNHNFHNSLLNGKHIDSMITEFRKNISIK